MQYNTSPFRPASWDCNLAPAPISPDSFLSSPEHSSFSSPGFSSSPNSSTKLDRFGSPEQNISNDSAYFGSPTSSPSGGVFSVTPTHKLSYHPTTLPTMLTPPELSTQPTPPVILTQSSQLSSPISCGPSPEPRLTMEPFPSLPPDLMDLYPAHFNPDPSYPLLAPYPDQRPDYNHPSYLDNLQNRIMRRKGAGRADKEKATLNYLKSLAREEQYSEMFVIISNFSFSQKNHSWIQTLWLRGIYAQGAKTQGRPLGPSERARLRRSNPFPHTISSDVESQRCGKDFLKIFYGINEYPSPEEKIMLSARCNMPYHKVNNWFRNQRARDQDGTEQLTTSTDTLSETLDLMMEVIRNDKDVHI